LITCGDFYKDDAERESDIKKMGSKLKPLWIDSNNAAGIVQEIKRLIQEKDLNTKDVMVQLPEVFKETHNSHLLKELKTSAITNGIRFMIINTNGLQKENKDKKFEYRRNIYSMMILARRIDAEISKNSDLYILLRGLISSMVGDDKNNLVDDYIKALAINDIAELVKMILPYRPIEEYDAVKEYHNISETLIAA